MLNIIIRNNEIYNKKLKMNELKKKSLQICLIKVQLINFNSNNNNLNLLHIKNNKYIIFILKNKNNK